MFSKILSTHHLVSNIPPTLRSPCDHFTMFTLSLQTSDPTAPRHLHPRARTNPPAKRPCPQYTMHRHSPRKPHASSARRAVSAWRRAPDVALLTSGWCFSPSSSFCVVLPSLVLVWCCRSRLLLGGAAFTILLWSGAAFTFLFGLCWWMQLLPLVLQ